MKVLALELSSPVGSVAFRNETGAQLVRAFPADRKDSGLFYENLRVIHQTCASPDLIVVGLGPGSYAGTRIAIATALGLKAASGARLLGLPSVCAMDHEEYVMVGDARRNSFFLAHVLRGRCLEGPTLANEEEVRAKLSAWRHLPILASQPLEQFENVTVAHPSALRLAELAGAADVDVEQALEPIYLREPYITIPKAHP